MKDSMLLMAIILAEQEPPKETDITLFVGGFLVSGYIISKKKYCTHHPISEGVSEILEKARKSELPEDIVEDIVEDKVRNFIHLRDAKIFIPGQIPIPGNYCRIQLESISAFFFGTLNTSK